MTAALSLMLRELRLPSIHRHWEEYAAEAIEKRWSAAEYLSHLCELEIADRETRRLTRHFQESRLPKGKSLQTYDFSAAPSVNEAQIQALSEDVSWIEQARNLLVFGPSGVGKTHLVAAIGEELIHRRQRVIFWRTTELCQHLEVAKAERNLPNFLMRLEKYDCLILDDFGYVRRSDQETQVLFELICHFYELRSLVLTCNQPFSSWASIFEDKAMAIAAIDRLVHHGTVVEIKGESYRRRSALGHQASGTLPPAGINK
jgi:DNA replication protein DnaC